MIEKYTSAAALCTMKSKGETTKGKHRKREAKKIAVSSIFFYS
jgi:hypothetical protein